MKKLFGKIKENILFVETLILLAFIPLYPKLPLINVKNTWVYVRVEDFLILGVLFTWIILLFRKKINLRTPLTLPIFAFWIIGAIATFNGILLIFPTLANVFPNVAFLSLVRHIEYLSLFFVAFAGMKDRKFLRFVAFALVATLVGVILYGFGQKYLGFPAFLTSNEEFAKGIPIQLSQLSRLPSTFAGHYDLAAYLVIMIPVVVSLFFGLKNLLIKAFLVLLALLSFVLLFWTVSRVSLFVVFVSLFMVLLFQKRKLALIAIPLICIAALVFLSLKPAVLDRFKNTVSEVDVLVDAQTGNSVGHVKFVPAQYFKNKIVLQRRVNSEAELVSQLAGEAGAPSSSLSAILPFEFIPPQVPLVQAVNVSTGESLPQGTGYINLTLSPVVAREGNFFYEFPPNVKASLSAQFVVLHGNFIIKRAAAYDLSFTTRFQGEWPRALAAFERNILTGSGYGSVSLAVDNNYLRMLGEIGLLGTLAFFVLFLSFGIFIKAAWKNLTPGLEKSFIIGFAAGVVGLALNAALIDVFESSKIAYILWMLMGVSFGILVLSVKQSVNLLSELKKLATSTYAVIVYLFGLTTVLYYQVINNFFIGDDFTWLRWAAQAPGNLLTYFTQSDGFFYRPGTKLYFYLMYHFFWLNPVMYHLVSIALHFIVAVLFFLLAKKIFKGTLLPAICAFLFLVMSGYTEMVFWIASTGHLFNAVFGLLGLLLFISWKEKKKLYLYLGSIAAFAMALLFHELGVVLPLLVLAYEARGGIAQVLSTIRSKAYLSLFTPVAAYLAIRLFSNSHWFNGDYSYDLVKLPFNFIGNMLGYAAVAFVGPASLNFYEKLRTVTRDHLLLSVIVIVVAIALSVAIFKYLRKLFDKEEKAVLVFGILFFVVSLLPFLGLGNITSRYSYLATLGLIPIFVVIIKKVYGYLRDSGKEIAVGAVTIFVLVFSLFHIISANQTAADWNGASVKTNNFFVSFDALYSNYWAKGPIEFHFVNVPIKYGQSWVFPVGLKDAVWFAVKNDDAKIFLDKDVNTALREVGNSTYNKIFQFNDSGSVLEIGERLIK
jgi:hypothetical protein